MSRGHVRSYKVCPICGEGFDAFKARDARGRYCSPACLGEARRRHRQLDAVEDLTPVGPAVLPSVITLGNLGAVVRLEMTNEDDDRRLV